MLRKLRGFHTDRQERASSEARPYCSFKLGGLDDESVNAFSKLGTRAKISV